MEDEIKSTVGMVQEKEVNSDVSNTVILCLNNAIVCIEAVVHCIINIYTLF